MEREGWDGVVFEKLRPITYSAGKVGNSANQGRRPLKLFRSRLGHLVVQGFIGKILSCKYPFHTICERTILGRSRVEQPSSNDVWGVLILGEQGWCGCEPGDPCPAISSSSAQLPSL